MAPDGSFLEPTFQARSHTRATRPDHVIVSQQLQATVHFRGVDLSGSGSDHYPLVLHLACLPQSFSVHPGSATDTVCAVSRLVWDSECRECYSGHVACSSGHAVFGKVIESLQSGDVTVAGTELMGTLRGLALDSGMRVRCPRLSRRTHACVRPVGKPWFDHECRCLKSEVRDALARRAPPEELRPLRWAFNALIRRKRRAHQRQRLHALLDDLRWRPKCYWDAFLPKADRLPPALQHPAAWTSAMHRALNPPCPEPTGAAIMEGSPPPGDGAGLLGPITRGEVVAALVGLKNYKATGYSGCPTELLKYAIIEDRPGQPVPADIDVAAMLAGMLDACFQCGKVPSAWNRMLVSPVFKRGDRGDHANYRPIAVSDALAKLYALVLNNRLLPWLERHGLRAPTQAGFRPGLGTAHPLFGLRHFIDVSARTKQPLYVCFVDLVKAYDTVHRGLLWHIMLNIGVPEQFVAAVRSMYRGVVCQVRVEGCLGPEFQSSIGVKQGCPLSPTLFGIFIDRLCFMMASRAGDVGPVLGSGRRVPSMLYADDLALVAIGRSAARHMHALLKVVDDFNAASGMQTNTAVGKTEMMLFGVSAAQRSSLQAEEFRVGGELIRFVMQYKYLGIIHHERLHWRADLTVRHSRAQRSVGVMHSCLASLEATTDVALAFRMHDVCVRPVQTYGSATWGTQYFSSDPGRVTQNLLEGGHLHFMRRWCRLRQNVPVWAMYKELGRLPLHYYWWREILRFWNQVASLPADSVWREIMMDNLADQHHRRRNWCGEVGAFLSGIGFSSGPLHLSCLDADRALECLLRRYDGVWLDLPMYPRLAASQVALTTYHRWMSREEWLDRPGYLFLRLGHQRTYNFVRFKLGCHTLGIVVGRWCDVPRAQRLCHRCDMGALDDERHLVFECPAFEDLRVAYRQLFGQVVAFDMRRFFAHKDQTAVVMYILDCLHRIQP